MIKMKKMLAMFLIFTITASLFPAQTLSNAQDDLFFDDNVAFSFHELSSEEPLFGALLLGDVNSDGFISSADVTLLRRYIAAGNREAFVLANPTFNRHAADIMGDGIIDNRAISLLRRYIAGENVILGSDENLTITIFAGSGGIAAAPATAAIGETVVISAAPDDGYKFLRWEVLAGAIPISPETQFQEFIMPNNSVELLAVFEPVVEYYFYRDNPVEHPLEWSEALANAPVEHPLEWDEVLASAPIEHPFEINEIPMDEEIEAEPIEHPLEWDENLENEPIEHPLEWDESLEDDPIEHPLEWDEDVANAPIYHPAEWDDDLCDYVDESIRIYADGGDFNALSAVFNVNLTSWYVQGEANNTSVNLTSSTNFPWGVISTAPSWLTVSNILPASRTGNGSFRINVTRNTGNIDRDGIIRASTNCGSFMREISVAQFPIRLELSANSWTPSSNASTSTITVTSDRTWNTPTSNATHWLTVDNISPTNRTGNGSFRIKADPNTGTTTRDGTITVVGGGITRTIFVTQGAAAATLTLGANSWNPPSNASSSTVSVTSNITWSTPTSNATHWLTVDNVSPTNRTGNGSFRINARINTETSSRSGTISVTGGGITRTISVTQEPPAATLSINTTSWYPTATASVSTVTVNSNRQWTVTSNAPTWLTADNFNPINRTGNGSFRMNVTANTGTVSREGTITVTAPGATTRTVSVAQAAPATTLTLSANSWNPSPAASNSTVNVTSNGTWSVSVSSNATSWLSVNNISPTSRTGNGSFRINATANTGTSARTGTITVSVSGNSRIIHVTQTGNTNTLSISANSWMPSQAASFNTVSVILVYTDYHLQDSDGAMGRHLFVKVIDCEVTYP
jgi:hypothetical protein